MLNSEFYYIAKHKDGRLMLDTLSYEEGAAISRLQRNLIAKNGPYTLPTERAVREWGYEILKVTVREFTDVKVAENLSYKAKLEYLERSEEFMKSFKQLDDFFRSVEEEGLDVQGLHFAWAVVREVLLREG